MEIKTRFTIKETSQGYPSEAGEKVYYFNCSSYYLSNFSLNKLIDFAGKLTAIKDRTVIKDSC